MSRIIVVGGHGKIALMLEKILAERGEQVSAMIRNTEHADEVKATGADAIVADVENLDAAQLADIFAGADAIVWSAGAGGGSATRTYAVDRDAAIRAMDAAATAGVQRFVMVSYFGASKDHGVPPDHSFFAYAEAKAEADDYLRATTLDWTILAPSSLTLDEPTGRISVTDASASSVTRADVAAVAAAVLERPSTVHSTIRFNNGDTPIADALDN